MNPKQPPIAVRSSTRAMSSGLNIGSEYTDEEREFFQAIEEFKRERRKPFPTWCEVLAVVRSLGYVRPDCDTAGVIVRDAERIDACLAIFDDIPTERIVRHRKALQSTIWLASEFRPG